MSPKKPPKRGEKLQYYVVAEHVDAKEKLESPKGEVEAGKPPQPLAVLTLGAVHFGFASSFLLPSAREKIAEFKIAIAKNPGAGTAVFGHADPVGDNDGNKKLSGRRAMAVYCLLSKDAAGWAKLAESDKWDLRTTQTMLAELKDDTQKPYYGGAVDGKNGPKTEAAVKAFQSSKGLQIDGVAGLKTHAKLYELYMDSICEVTCKYEDFLGDPSDPKRQWACIGCGELNPVLVFSKTDDDKFRSSGDKAARDAKNAPNRRATVMLFPSTAKGPGSVTFPCPSWDADWAKCKEQLFDDCEVRRNPSDAERTWEKDKDTFGCMFYAGISKEPDMVILPKNDIFIVGWLDSLTEFVPIDLQIIFEGEGKQTFTWSDGVVDGAYRSFSFLIKNQSEKHALRIQSGSKDIILWSNYCFDDGMPCHQGFIEDLIPVAESISSNVFVSFDSPENPYE